MTDCLLRAAFVFWLLASSQVRHSYGLELKEKEPFSVNQLNLKSGISGSNLPEYRSESGQIQPEIVDRKSDSVSSSGLNDSEYLAKSLPQSDSEYLIKSLPQSDSNYLTETLPQSDSKYLTETLPQSDDSKYLTETLPQSDSIFLTETFLQSNSKYLIESLLQTNSKYVTETLPQSDSKYLTESTSVDQSPSLESLTRVRKSLDDGSLPRFLDILLQNSFKELSEGLTTLRQRSTGLSSDAFQERSALDWLSVMTPIFFKDVGFAFLKIAVLSLIRFISQDLFTLLTTFTLFR